MAGYQVVRLPNGTCTVQVASYGEKMHPGLGPAAEAEALYVRQLRIPDRMREEAGEFAVWDIGLGAAANAVALLRATRDIQRPLRLVSFDNTAGPLDFALQHALELEYLNGYETTLRELMERKEIEFTDGGHRVNWEFHLEDFPAWLTNSSKRSAPIPHAIFFDAFSPAKNPAMWTLSTFTNLFRQLDPQRPCALTTYSRSTLVRVTLLLAGFYVGRGRPTGLKEETTVAANAPGLLDDPLPRTWLERARRSDSAEPMREPVYCKAPLTAESWERLQAHPQFA